MSESPDLSPEDRQRLLDEALGQPWYHRVEVAPGMWTNGAVRISEIAPKLLPPRLDGLRVMDVGTFDGAWAFELENRGPADVYAVDLPSHMDTEWPPRNARYLRPDADGKRPDVRFNLAHRLRGSKIKHVDSRIYDINPDLVGGPVDYAVISDLLLHLRDPIAGLAAVRSALKPTGRLLVSEQVNVWLTVVSPRKPAASLQTDRTDYNWWEANAAALREWLHQAGFARPHAVKRFKLPAGKDQAVFHMAFEQRPDPEFVP